MKVLRVNFYDGANGKSMEMGKVVPRKMQFTQTFLYVFQLVYLFFCIMYFYNNYCVIDLKNSRILACYHRLLVSISENVNLICIVKKMHARNDEVEWWNGENSPKTKQPAELSDK